MATDWAADVKKFAPHADDAVVVKTWDEVRTILEADYPGKAKVAVVQDGTMQYILPPGSG